MDINVTREAHKAMDTDIEDMQDFHPVDTNHFEDLEHNNLARLTAITRELDDLHQHVQAEEGQPSEAFKLHRMRITGLTAQSTNTYRTPWGYDKTLYKHSVFCPETNQPDKLLATRCIGLQWTQHNSNRGLASAHRNCS